MNAEWFFNNQALLAIGCLVVVCFLFLIQITNMIKDIDDLKQRLAHPAKIRIELSGFGTSGLNVGIDEDGEDVRIDEDWEDDEAPLRG